MKRSNLSTLASLSALGLSAVLGACKLDLGGGSGSDKAQVTTSDAAAPDADAGADASAPGADGGAPDGPTTSSDGGTGSETGTPPNAQPWSATPPAPDAVRVTLDVTGDQTCSFELSYLVENPGADQQLYSTLLEKKDASPGSCPDAKGFIYLTQHSYADPAGVARRHSTDQIIAVAWVERAVADGNAPNTLRLAQIDWATGTDLHEGIMSVKGTPPDATSTLRPTSMNLSVGYDVILDGTGAFPGATGAGDTFEATWSNFLGTAPQAPSQADSATQQ